MIKFKDYENLNFGELFEGFYILREKEIDELIMKSGNDRLDVSGGLRIMVYPNDGTLKLLISPEIKSGRLTYPSRKYFQNTNLYTLSVNFKATVWFTSNDLTKKFIAKFSDNRKININKNSILYQSIYIISDKKPL